MKTNRAGTENRPRSRSLSFKLTCALIFFALILMGLIWLLQTVFLERYYESSMEKKAGAALSYVSSIYAESEELDLAEYEQTLQEMSKKNDMFFYAENEDGSVTLSSDTGMFGRRARGDQKTLEEVRARLYFGEGNSVSFKAKDGPDANVLISVSKVESEYRETLFIYAYTTLTPLGPAVEIIKRQLFIVTLISLLLAAVIAVFYSRKLAKPVTDISGKAKLLTHGEYDVDFSAYGYREIEELGDILSDAADELEKADNLQKDLIANISHDLRTPLTMIKSYAELIRDIYGNNEAKRNESLEVIIDETDRLSDLVSDLLTLSKLQAGNEALEKSVFDISKSAENIIKVYLVLEKEGFKFELVKPDHPVMVNGDERKLQQVLSNLLSNAIRYSDEIKDISVVIEEKNGWVRCSVNDCGIGIDEKDLANIWNRYQKASRQGVRGRRGGTGLGLSIAKEILEQHGARYGVSSQPGVGSSFWFALPVIRRK
ncbi:MAG: HAMP domain-containing histidine kinase [Firmicutes bacterium]|nr:HAMP domain-containing histidine kinase [Bacillota bacterium]